MRNPFKRRKSSGEVVSDYVDFDQDVITLGGSDPSARFLRLSMKYGPVLMNATKDGWTLIVAGQVFAGATQTEAIDRAESFLADRDG